MKIENCPDHPNSKVVQANIATTNKSVWLCLSCGRKLGDAGPRKEPITEKLDIRKGKG